MWQFSSDINIAALTATGHTAPLKLDYIPHHSVPECGFEGLKTYQAPAHSWDLPR